MAHTPPAEHSKDKGPTHPQTLSTPPSQHLKHQLPTPTIHPFASQHPTAQRISIVPSEVFTQHAIHTSIRSAHIISDRRQPAHIAHAAAAASGSSHRQSRPNFPIPDIFYTAKPRLIQTPRLERAKPPYRYVQDKATSPIYVVFPSHLPTSHFPVPSVHQKHPHKPQIPSLLAHPEWRLLCAYTGIFLLTQSGNSDIPYVPATRPSTLRQLVEGRPPTYIHRPHAPLFCNGATWLSDGRPWRQWHRPQ